MTHRRQERQGFTIIELIVVLGIMVILIGVAMPYYSTSQMHADLDVAAASIVQDLRQAQIMSQSVSGDGTWGVSVGPGSIVLFQGSSYAARNTSYDQITSIASNIVPSGATEIVFSRMDGLPLATGSFTLTSNSLSRVISVNSQGLISY
jgi:prepilin-type N-terminal cleavage/methylation domain-containing protein